MHVEVRRVDDDMPLFDRMAEYSSIKLNCCYPYNDRPDNHEYLRECSRFLEEHPSKVLSRDVDRHDPGAILEVGFRCVENWSLSLFPDSPLSSLLC